MGYSKSKTSVERYKDILTALAASSKDIKLKSPNPVKLAYKIREAIRVARLYPNSYPDFQELTEKYVIKTKDDYLLFELRNNLISSPIEELANSLVMTFDECKTILEVIGALVKHKPIEAVFPVATIVDQLDILHKWTHKNDYYINEVLPLTISRTETPESWKPQV